jgi:hypothetical protein
MLPGADAPPVIWQQTVLICGWYDTPFMLELLNDLDRGTDMLPRGSEVILLNLHESDEISAHLKRLGRFRNIAVRHILGNPLHREDLKKVHVHNTSCRSPPPQFHGRIRLCCNLLNSSQHRAPHCGGISYQRTEPSSQF